jgi:hypothetical protein
MTAWKNVKKISAFSLHEAYKKSKLQNVGF